MPKSFIYWTDPLVDTFDVTIVSCVKGEEGYEVVIDDPVVRPEGGGQAGDRGSLVQKKKTIEFFDTREQDGNLILVCKAPVEKGAATLQVDMAWRRASMRNHSAEHLFVSQMKRIHKDAELGYIWIDGEHGTVDVHGSEITLEEVFAAEREVQRIIAEDVPLDTRIVPANELDETVRAREGVTKKHGEVRIVSFGDYDSSACSGVHVLSTGDIKLFKVVNCKFADDRVRVEFMTGERAIEEVTKVYNEVLSRRETYPFEMEQIGAVLDRSKHVLIERDMLVEKMEELITSRLGGETIEDLLFVAELLPGFESGDLRRILKKIPFKGKMAVLLFTPDRKSNFIFAVNELGQEAKEIIGPIVQNLGGRGGGSRDVFTGGFTDVEDPLGLFEQLKNKIRERLSKA
ncbi:MAG: hypothetical protein K9W43_13920 [Candidatus Thorarchaeota archaeon]|nr:hypothetical protein [Candidatus Thorarchaeota archaeon]